VDYKVLTLAKKRNITIARCDVNMIKKYHVASRTMVLNRLGTGTLFTLDRTTR